MTNGPRHYVKCMGWQQTCYLTQKIEWTKNSTSLQRAHFPANFWTTIHFCYWQGYCFPYVLWVC